MRDVVITGIGMRTPMGNTLDAVRRVYASGQPVVKAYTAPQGHTRVMAVLDEGWGSGFSRMDQMMLDEVTQLAVLAADDAVADSGMKLADADRDRIGVVVGTGQGTACTVFETTRQVDSKGSAKTFSILRGLNNGCSNHVSMRHGLRGECQTLMLACSSSNAALGSAMRLIQAGVLDAALAGGADVVNHEITLRAWEALRILAKPDPERPETSSRPFSKSRTGLVLGEGAVIYMLEEASQARARGARIYARLAGYGTSSDATNIAHPDPDGQALALRACLKSAGLAPEDIGYVNAHGTATPTGDPAEVKSIKAVFGAHAQSLPVSSTKSLHGHLLGAAGAIELLAPIVALNDGLLAPTANLDEPDPECDLDFVPNQARQVAPLRAAMSSNFAFGGSNAVIALTRD